ncbi:uncharacterized protein LOC130647308 isoform X2 [Hydractinia symbiolongicarpus]|uniref:uncharacterized protein LOC130647308 isoform X2 n=1 Tax=Hydractinia symbiolongicarpus TaxID=13093 RepID=UPI00254ED9ED|nr:uncharacterized protein LOC130647308 isoform X2 [Hydractinia symbiolongicarpus]
MKFECYRLYLFFIILEHVKIKQQRNRKRIFNQLIKYEYMYSLILQMSILSWIKGKTGSTMEKSMEKLEDFGYYFDKDGVLKNLDGSGKGFIFQVYSSQRENQLRYERLGNVVDKHIFQLLEKEAKLQRITIPIDGKKGSRGFIFASTGYKKAEKLLLLVHGSGVVRAGQWSRRLIINNSLNKGSQLPYIQKAKQLDFGVLVLNSNQNHDDRGDTIQGSETPEKHFHYVWKHFVASSKAKHVAIVAHSYGGVITVHEAAINPEMRKRTFAVAFTDSVHGYMGAMGSEKREFFDWMNKRVCNWVSSREPLDERLGSRQDDCVRMSAGTPVHEETSWKAFDSVWRFIEEKLSERLSQRQDGSVDRQKMQNPRQDASKGKLTAKRHDVHQQEIDKENVRQSRVLTRKGADVNNKANSQTTVSSSRGQKRSYATVCKTISMKAADCNNVKKRIDDKCSPGVPRTISERAIPDTCEKKLINNKVDDVRKDATCPVVGEGKESSKVDDGKKDATSPVVAEGKTNSKVDDVRKDATSAVFDESKADSKVDDVRKEKTSSVVSKRRYTTSPVISERKECSKVDDVRKDATSGDVGGVKRSSKADDVRKDATSGDVGKVKNPTSFEIANKDKKVEAEGEWTVVTKKGAKKKPLKSGDCDRTKINENENRGGKKSNKKQSGKKKSVK